MTTEKAIDILCTCREKPDWKHTEGMIEEACRIVSALRPPPNAPLTLEELREMDDAAVWVAYPPSIDGEQLIMHALVEVVKENGVVWLTNNLGGRSTFDEVSEDGALAYRRKPEEVTA